MNGEIIKILQHLERERGVDRESLIQAIESALLSAAKKRFGETADIKAGIDRKTGIISLINQKKVVATVSYPEAEISLAEALKIDPELKEGDICEVKIPPEDFGRIAAQTAKQVMIQKIREAERDMVFQEFKPKEGEILTCLVDRFEHGNVILNMDQGKAEAILLNKDRIAGEKFKHGERIKVYVLEVRKSSRGPQLIVSRTDSGLVRRLFELEVPEIREGIVEIKGVAREPGDRTKIAVYSRMENVDCVGTCVGVKGARVKNIIKELGMEKIDIIPWSEDSRVFISNALNPARILDIEIKQKEGSSTVFVAEDQLSLAIGKGGQNARLAAKLTGWKIDIKIMEKTAALSIPGVGEKTTQKLAEGGFKTLEDIAGADIEKLVAVKGIGKKTAEKILKLAKKKVESQK